MERTAAEIEELIDSLATHSSDDARHCLIDAGSRAVPFLQKRYQLTEDVETRANYVRLAAECDPKAAFDFMILALESAQKEIWREALSGLVANGASAALEAVMIHVQAKGPGQSAEKKDWCVEAVEQIRDGMSPSNGK